MGDILESRMRKVIDFANRPKIIFPIILIFLIILGVYIRMLPMTTHGEVPGLWNYATSSWSLGPDLDPWSFLKNAKIIAEDGGIPAVDTLRNVPLGVDNSRETILLPYMIYGVYSLVNIFGDFSMEFAGALFPVIMFGLTILAFFLFVREIFISKGYTFASSIASISTLFFVIIPALLARTVAGIPEKESAGFLFMFLSFYMFLRSIRSDNLKGAIPWAIAAGISTAIMRFIWGGAVYIFATICITMILAFLFNKVSRKIYYSYSAWLFTSCFVMVAFSNWFTLSNILILPYTSVCILAWVFMTMHLLLWDTEISSNKVIAYLNKHIPKNVLSVVVSMIFLIPLSLVVLGPQPIYEISEIIYELLFNPVIGRWNTTVAENRIPFLQEWIGNFGPFLGSIPIMFILFSISSIMFFRETFTGLDRKDLSRLTIFYIFLVVGLVFSRVSTNSVLNGETIVSKLLFLGSIVAFSIAVLYYAIKYILNKKEGFEMVKLEYILLLALLLISLLTVRGMIRLVIIFASIAPIFIGYIIVKLFYNLTSDGVSITGYKDEDDIGIGVVMAISLFSIVLLLSLYSGYTHYETITASSYNFVPNYYNIQWQFAMDWVDKETPADSVFASWWDYGYWIQALGHRATVTDGGNIITYWNYLMGRQVLTSDNQHDALEFLYNHDVDYLLIDSSDIGKYGAFSSIGSDDTYDRFSTVPTLLLDQSQIHESNNITTFFYGGGAALDEDITYIIDGKSNLFPVSQSYIYGISILKDKEIVVGANLLIFNKAVITKVPLRYAQYNGIYYDFGYGVNGTAKIITRVDRAGSISQDGAMIYISPRVSKTLFSDLYLLDDPMGKYPGFSIVHSAPNVFTNSNDIFYYDPVGIIGPIKIWSVEYSGDEGYRDEYTDIDSTKYLGWRL